MDQRTRSRASDAELLARFATGRDQRAFAEIVRRHGGMVRSVARRMLHDGHDAEDAFQAAFFALAKSAGRVRWQENAAGWLHQTTVRSAKAILRMNADWNRKQENGTKNGATDVSQLSAVELEELRKAIDEELQRLPVQYSAAIVQCDLEELSRKEAAVRLGVPLGTVDSRLKRGRKLLRERLVRRGLAFSTAAIAAYSGAAGGVGAATAGEVAHAAAHFASTNSSIAALAKPATIAQGVLQQMMVTKIVSTISPISAAMLAVAAAIAATSSATRAQGLEGCAFDATICWRDTFDDGSITNGVGGKWQRQFGHGIVDLTNGELHVTTNSGFEGVLLQEFDGQPVTSSREWSFRALMTIHSGNFAGVGTSVFNHAALMGNSLRAGTDAFDTTLGVLPAHLYPYLGEQIFVQMDAFDNKIIATAWREGEEDSLFRVERPYSPTNAVPDLGLGGNGSDHADVTFHEVWISDRPIPIPEPGAISMAILGAALLGLSAWRFYR